MESKSKILSYIALVLNFLLFGFFAFYYIRRNFLSAKVSEFMILLPYFIILIITPLIVIIKSEKFKNWIKFLINGLIIGGGISLLIILASILLNLKLIMSDGTAFWAFVELPIVYIGYFSFVIGAITGLIVGWIYWIYGKIKHKN